MCVKNRALRIFFENVGAFFYIWPKSFLCPEKLLQAAQPGGLQGENPVKAGGGRAAVREDETGINQCARNRM